MKNPREFSDLWCKASGKPGWFHLTFSKERGFFEPVTNQDAEPIIDKITHWQYDEPPPHEFG